MKIAIVGAGFAGLSAAWHCSSLGEVALFDPQLGGGASGVAAGLLHPFTGSAKKVAPWVREGMQEAKKLLLLAGQPVSGGILRYATSDQERKTFSSLPLHYQGVRWDGTLHIDEGVAVDAPAYLKGLLKACTDAGVAFVEKKITSLEELEGYDARVLAVGAGVFDFTKIRSLRPVKGQLLVYNKPFPCPAIGIGYVAGPYLGATFEHRFENSAPDLDKAYSLLAASREFFDAKEEPIGCVAGVRVMGAPGAFPLIEEIAPSTWVLSGLGSKGLLTHGLLGKQLAQRIKSRIIGPS